MGARPLQRYIQRELETPIARRIIADEIGPGETIKGEAGEEGVVVG